MVARASPDSTHKRANERDRGAVTTEQLARIRSARAKLRASQCTCLPNPKGHDDFDLECKRTAAEVDYDNALAAAGIEL